MTDKANYWLDLAPWLKKREFPWTNPGYKTSSPTTNDHIDRAIDAVTLVSSPPFSILISSTETCRCFTRVKWLLVETFETKMLRTNCPFLSLNLIWIQIIPLLLLIQVLCVVVFVAVLKLFKNFQRQSSPATIPQNKSCHKLFCSFCELIENNCIFHSTELFTKGNLYTSKSLIESES